MSRHSFDRLRLSLLASLGALVACSGGNGAGFGLPNAGAGSGSGGSASIGFGSGGQGSGATGNSGTTVGSAGNTAQNCNPGPVDGCQGVSYEAESIPHDIYIMFDQSGSMQTDVGGMTRLQAVQRATEQFLRDPDSAAISVGIGYFGFLPIGQVSCDQKTYATPAVDITLNHEAVISSLDARMPTGETPTSAALDGACSYATNYRQHHAGRGVVILLVTDGKPEAPASCAMGGCCPTLAQAVASASTCAGTGVPTYVLGVGPLLDSLNQIAEGGGTKSAYLVGDQDVTTNVLNALRAIRGDAKIPCDLEIPPANPGETIDYTRVNVFYAPAGDCNYAPVYGVQSKSSCDANGGWYYDNPSAPTTVKLCPTSCSAVSQPGAGLKLSLGCDTVTVPR